MIQLRRVTSSGAYIPEVDGVRFIAILLVVLYHLTGDILRHSPAGYAHSVGSNPFFWMSERGIFGIQMFFVVSGFVLALPFAANRLAGGRPAPNLKRYYLRRLTRLEPPYLCALFLFLMLKILGGRGTLASLAPHLLASIFYQHNLIYGAPSTVEFVAWTLEIEVQFYLIAPLVAAIAYRSHHSLARRAGIVAAMLISAAVATSLYPLSPRFQLSLLCSFQYFVAGFLLADLYVSMRHDSGESLAWDTIAIAGLAAPYLWMYLALPMDYCAPATLLLAYYAIFRSVVVRRILSVAPVSIVGGMCYSIYLVHNYVIAAAGFLTENLGAGLSFSWRFGIQSLLILPLVLAVSMIFFIAIERPCMNPDWTGRVARWLGLLGRADSPGQTAVPIGQVKTDS